MTTVLTDAKTTAADGDLTAPSLVGRAAIAKEISGLELLLESLGADFDDVVEAVVALNGRLVVSGIGKSGHVARKIAATLASTGTLAFYIHPSEASHGDLGMISRHDMVLALSNSGETAELSDMIHYCGRQGIPLIAMTSQPGSALARSAQYRLLTPRAEEACAVGMAPTTSTTMMMALGDALAVALMERRGFTRDHFRNFHPGGRLGQTLMRVDKIMHGNGNVPLVGLRDTMDEIVLVITAKSVGCAGVVDDQGRLVGIITDGDMRRHMSDGFLAHTAEEVMSRKPKTIKRDMLVGEALAIMNRFEITCLFVVEDDKPVGVVNVHDCLRAGFA